LENKPVIKLNTVLHDKQNQIHENPARFKVSMLGGQFGKTELAVFDLIQAGLGKKNGTFWYVCPSYGMAESIVWVRLKLSIPPQYLLKRPREDDLTVFLISGSILVLKGADNYDSLRGVPLDGVIVDEGAFMQRDVWEDVLRPRLMAKKGFAHFYSTPKGLNWFTELHAEARRRMMAGDSDWASFHYTSWENPYLDRAELQRLKESMPDYKYQQEIMANPTENTGLRFPHFNFDNNVGKYNGTNTLTLYRGIDSGIAQNHPTTCIWAEVDLNDRMIYITDEYGKSGAIIKDCVEQINNITGNRIVECSVIDPSTAKRNNQTLVRDIDEFSRYGLRCVPGDNKARGYDIVNMWLKSGRLKIHPKCKELIYELSHVSWQDKLFDDYVDSLRYCIVRINDFMYGMNLNDIREQKSDKPELFNREMTIDQVKLMTEENKPKSMNWVEHEIYGLSA